MAKISKNKFFPTEVTLDISTQCNLKCTICSLKEYYNPKGLMSDKVFREAEKIFPYLEYVDFNCNAEPLLHPNLINFLKIVKKYPNLKVGFPTNGLLLNKKLIRELILNDLDLIRISIDGLTKKTYNSIRQGGEFKKLVSNIKNLIKIKKQLKSEKPLISLIFVAMKNNIHELPSLIDFAKKIKIDHITVHGLEVYERELLNEALYSAKEDYSCYFLKAQSKAKKYGIDLKLPFYKKKGNYPCQSSRFCLITWEGDVVPCTPLSYSRSVYFENKKLWLKKISFGNVNKKPLIKILNSRDYIEFKKVIAKGCYHKNCKACLMKYHIIVPQQPIPD